MIQTKGRRSIGTDAPLVFGARACGGGVGLKAVGTGLGTRTCMRVLVTGASGNLGQQLVGLL